MKMDRIYRIRKIYRILSEEKNHVES